MPADTLHCPLGENPYAVLAEPPPLIEPKVADARFLPRYHPRQFLARMANAKDAAPVSVESSE